MAMYVFSFQQQTRFHSCPVLSCPVLTICPSLSIYLSIPQYVWAVGATDHTLYDHPDDSVDFQPNLGSLPNHHCILNSLGSAASANVPYHDNTVSNRTTTSSPAGLGAFTYNTGRVFYANRDLKAGEEIVSYRRAVHRVFLVIG